MKVINGDRQAAPKEERFAEFVAGLWDASDYDEWQDAAQAALGVLSALASVGNPYHIIGLLQACIIHIYRAIEEEADE